MAKYYEVLIHQTSRPVNGKPMLYETFNIERKSFGTIAEARKFIEEMFWHKCKRTKMYVDRKDGSAQHVGWIYHYKVPKSTQDPRDHGYYEQDWVEVREIHATPILI